MSSTSSKLALHWKFSRILHVLLIYISSIIHTRATIPFTYSWARTIGMLSGGTKNNLGTGTLEVQRQYLSYENLCSQGICISWVKNKIRICISCEGNFRVQYGICNLISNHVVNSVQEIFLMKSRPTRESSPQCLIASISLSDYLSNEHTAFSTFFE